MQRFDQKVNQYIIDHTTPPDELLNELERQTYLKILRPQMVSGPLQGKVLEMLSCMMQPQFILELGTYTGYSAICLAKGLKPGGELHTIDINDELEDFVRPFFQRCRQANQIHYHLGDAFTIVPQINRQFDLIFIDADKRQYPEYYELVINKLKPGGFIIADDVLWYGKIDEQVNANDAYTIGLQKFNDLVQNDQRVENVIFPIRDGLMIIRKK